MKQLYFNGQWVTLVDVYMVYLHGAWVTDAVFSATGKTLSASELEQLTDMYQDKLYKEKIIELSAAL